MVGTIETSITIIETQKTIRLEYTISNHKEETNTSTLEQINTHN